MRCGFVYAVRASMKREQVMSEEIKRLMPEKLELGHNFASCIGEAMLHMEDDDEPNPLGLRKVMGFFLPEWQRGLVWSEDQNIKLIESLWLGVSIGTYTFNRKWGSEYNNLLIDGQQRLNAIERYLNDCFPVFGYRWSETTKFDKRRFRHTCHFHSFITESDDDAYLRSYYNMMNFGGTAHKESERA